MIRNLLTLAILCLSVIARADDVTEYRPELTEIAGQKQVPKAIARAAKRSGTTRFFATFALGKENYAVWVSDQGQPRAGHPQNGESGKSQDSRADVFQRAPNRSWRASQSFVFTRRYDTKRDQPRITANALWFDPARQTIPMIYIKIMEDEYGDQTDVYGLLTESLSKNTFISFNGYIPYNPSTITTSFISFPDAEGHLTILDVTSDPGYTTQTAYGWKNGWQEVDSASFDNAYETALYWNGARFVPLAKP